MRIACIGWGSLTWDPQELKVEKKWYDDGPILPVEFTRISDDDRVTLVIDHYAAPQMTMWALISTQDLDEAIGSLIEREHTSLKNVHFITIDGTPQTSIEKVIQEWLLEKRLDAAIWTGLSYSKKTDSKRPPIDDIIDHLNRLTGEASERAKEYITKAPKQINTEYRREIENSLGWKHQ